jgi:glycosyltransferase involved in cell wall biosynthesis
MRLLFVVQRYGVEVAGGAERACRDIADRLAAHGHTVEVVTSCAVSYVDWDNYYPPGRDIVGGIVVHRLPVARPREDRIFGPLNARVVVGHPPVPLHLQETWMQHQGPYLPALPGWLFDHAPGYDAVLFFTYLYWPISAGLPAVAGRVPTVLLPFAHDEPYIQLPFFDKVFRLPDALAFLTEEEQALVHARFGARRPSAVIGLGIEDDLPVGDIAELRSRYGIGDRPYLLALGRVDPAKGLDELFAFFTAYKARNPGPLALVVMGEPIRPLPEHPDVIPTGFVAEETKRAALAGSVALVHPSYFESFSIVLTEAWAQGRPALVQGNCAVLQGQARRSGGALPYFDYPTFEEAVQLLVNDEQLAKSLGAAGKRYVAERYEWDAVVGRLERLLRMVVPKMKLPAT